jgi:hypothetical protein
METSILTTTLKIIPPKLIIPIAVIIFSISVCKNTAVSSYKPVQQKENDSTYIQKLLHPIIHPPSPTKQ